jgi:hypothetical protein
VRSRTASRKWRGNGERFFVVEERRDGSLLLVVVVVEEDEREVLQALTAQVRKLTVRSFILK